MITILDLGLNVIAYHVNGKVQSADVERVFQEVDVRLASGERFNVYAEVESITGMSLPALAKDLRMGLQRLDVLRRIDKAALVTDNEWLRMIGMVDDKVLKGVHVRVFGLTERLEAQAWVRT